MRIFNRGVSIRGFTCGGGGGIEMRSKLRSFRSSILVGCLPFMRQGKQDDRVRAWAVGARENVVKNRGKFAIRKF
jgi:hypothetical protein